MKMSIIALAVMFPLMGMTTVNVKCGKASWYGGKFHGRTTANGEKFNKNAMTAASKTLKFGTVLLVTNKSNGRSVKVRINDRGPYVGNRILDVSKAAAVSLGFKDKGVTTICMKKLR